MHPNVIKYGREDSVYLLRVLYLFFIYVFFIDFLAFFLFFFLSLFTCYQIFIMYFSLFVRVKLIDYQCVNRSDFKPGSGPGFMNLRWYDHNARFRVTGYLAVLY